MVKLLSLFIMQFFVVFGLQSQVVTKTLIIDTLQIEADAESFQVLEQNAMLPWVHSQVNRETVELNLQAYPNFICKVKLYNDSSTVKIYLDDKGGFIELHNLYSLTNDTIQIEKYRYFKNCLNDTTFKKTTYWNETDTGLVYPPFKVEYHQEIHESFCDSNCPESLYLVVNGEEYCISIVQRSDFELMVHFHGHSPRRYRNKRTKYKRKKKIYFSGRSVQTAYFHVGIINIDHHKK